VRLRRHIASKVWTSHDLEARAQSSQSSEIERFCSVGEHDDAPDK
jgi:hypothetical protein